MIAATVNIVLLIPTSYTLNVYINATIPANCVNADITIYPKFFDDILLISLFFNKYKNPVIPINPINNDLYIVYCIVENDLGNNVAIVSPNKKEVEAKIGSAILNIYIYVEKMKVINQFIKIKFKIKLIQNKFKN